MSHYASVLLASAMIVCGAGSAHAQAFNEVRVGLLDHDTGIVGTSKEDGVDLGVELLSPPIEALRIIGSPRAVVGVQLNSEGYTNMVYAGLQADWTFAESVFTPNDAFYLEGTVGGGYIDGEDDVRDTPEEAEWKSHGSPWVFRTGFGVGYRVNETWSVTATFSHISNAELAQPNEGSNDIGVRVGMRF